MRKALFVIVCLLLGLIGVAAGTLPFVPASYLARWVENASDGRVLLAQAQGSVWSGEAQPVLVTGGKIDGKRIMEVTGEGPGPRIGWILHALLEEVLNDPAGNTAENMEKRALELAKIDDKALREIGEKGKDRKEEEDEAAVRALREKHHVK